MDAQDSSVAIDRGYTRAAYRWMGRCLVVGAILTAPSAFILHPPLFNPYDVKQVVQQVAKDGDWHWLHVLALVGGTLLVGGYTLWAWTLHERRLTNRRFNAGLAPLFSLGISWVALSLWLPLVTFEAAGLPRVSRKITAIWPGNTAEQGLITLVHGLWSAMLATAYLVAALYGVVALILTEAEARAALRTGTPSVISNWLRVLAWISGVGTLVILPVAWAFPKWASVILTPPGIAYFSWAIFVGVRMSQTLT